MPNLKIRAQYSFENDVLRYRKRKIWRAEYNIDLETMGSGKKNDKPQAQSGIEIQ